MVTLYVRTAGDPLASFAAIRAAMKDLDPTLPFEAMTLQTWLNTALGKERLAAAMLTGSGCLRRCLPRLACMVWFRSLPSAVAGDWHPRGTWRYAPCRYRCREDTLCRMYCSGGGSWYGRRDRAWTNRRELTLWSTAIGSHCTGSRVYVFDRRGDCGSCTACIAGGVHKPHDRPEAGVRIRPQPHA
jgi:hypothetical protein